MKAFALSLACVCACALMSCNGGGDAQQTAAPAAPAAQPAVTDTTAVAQQPPAQAAPAQAQALPEAINAFIQKHFPGSTVTYVETDHDMGGLQYDVTLNDGTQVDFTPNNDWDKVDCHTKAVPAALVPAAIAGYVKANFQSTLITKIDKEPSGYEIELSNGVDLKFAPNGQFMGVDD